MPVRSRPIVERLDVVGNVSGCQIPVLVDQLLDALLLEAAEERPGNGIVPTVPSSTHAGLEPIGAAEAAPFVAAILTPLVGMNDGSTWSASFHCHHDCIQDELATNCRPGRPADDLP